MATKEKAHPSVLPEIIYRDRTLSSNVISAGTISDLSFYSVPAGKYRISANIRIETQGNFDAYLNADGPNGSIFTKVGRLDSFSGAQGGGSIYKCVNHFVSKIFDIDTAGDIILSAEIPDAAIFFALGAFSQLETLKHHTEIT